MIWILTSLLLMYAHLEKNRFSGFDERYIYHSHVLPNDNITINEIIQIDKKKNAIYFLKSTEFTLEEKLDFVQDKRLPSIYNVFNGGLLDDWEFEM